MDLSSFDRLSKAIAAVGSRRAVARVLAALPLASAGGLLLADDSEARRKGGKGRKAGKARKRRKNRRQRDRKRNDLHNEKKKSKGKLTFCLNGQTVSAPKKKKKTLLKQGATAGACAPAACTPEASAATCAGKCGSVQNNCGTAVSCEPCPCVPECGECFTCDPGTRTCVATPGASCGSAGQVCGGDGSCACTATSCPACRTCGNDGVCAGCAGCCDGDACVAACGACEVCGADGQCAPCPGCCDTGGVCQPGDADAACGQPGTTCAACTAPQTCGGGGDAGLCGCTPTTCAAEGKNCGSISDTCGGTIPCGDCPHPNQPCASNVCGACVPDCTGKVCGADDGCGAACATGICTAPETCGGGGVTAVCGCTPTTCAALGKTCGQISDGCSTTLDCGTCLHPGQPCEDNVCGTCVPDCAGKACGADDDCGFPCLSGTCTAPQTCGGGGATGVCGCTPTTCAAEGKTCGSISDGCGGTLPCGTCSNPTPVCTASNTCAACTDDDECGTGKSCCSGQCRAPVWANQATFGAESTGPCGVAVSPDGLTVWVANNANPGINVWTRQNASSTAWSLQTTFGSSGSAPFGVAVSADLLTVCYADDRNHRISVWTRPNTDSITWSLQSTFGSSGSGPNNLYYPRGVALSPDLLTVWVADGDNHRISVWTRSTADDTAWSYSAQIGSGTAGNGPNQLRFPYGVAVSPDGLVAWIADSSNYRISVWTRPNAGSDAWSNQTTFGSYGTGLENFSYPFSVAVSTNGLTVWVTDYYHNRISVWTRAIADSTVWTNSTAFYSPAPMGVAVSPDSTTLWATVVPDAFAAPAVFVWSFQTCPA